MSDSVQTQRRQPSRLPHPWDSPGKNTGVGCHFLLQCVKVKVKVKLLSHVCWIIQKAREFQKNIFFCFIDYAKAFDYVDHNKLWEIIKEIGIPDPDHLIYLLRNLYAGQEAIVKNGHETTDWFHIGKGVRQGCILSPCLFYLHAGLDLWQRVL